jgi:peptide chain release factor 1
MDIRALEKKYSVNSAKQEKTSLEQRMLTAHTTGENMSKISADLAYYTTLSNIIDSINKAIVQYKESQELLNDPDMKELAKSDLEQKEELLTQLDSDAFALQAERQFSDEDDDRSAILEIRAGAGGDEASLFAADIFRMYKNFAMSKGWEVEIIESNITEGGGYKEVIAHINGKNVFKHLKYESGVHRVQRIPSTEASGRIHTSTVSVAILPEAKEIDVDIKPEDIRIDVMRASGAGGQCVNKTDSAVRITHYPTGIVVSCQETKHQAQNKEKAMTMLRSRIYEMKRQEEHDKRDSMRSSQIGSAMRAEKIRTYNFPQNRITDHRVKISWHNLEGILNGSIEEMLNDVRQAVQIALLAEINERD